MTNQERTDLLNALTAQLEAAPVALDRLVVAQALAAKMLPAALVEDRSTTLKCLTRELEFIGQAMERIAS